MVIINVVCWGTNANSPQQICVNNMMSAAKAQELGCDNNDLKCLCGKPDFAYGFRDCAIATCGSGDDAMKIANYAIQSCQGKLGSAYEIVLYIS